MRKDAKICLCVQVWCYTADAKHLPVSTSLYNSNMDKSSGIFTSIIVEYLHNDPVGVIFAIADTTIETHVAHLALTILSLVLE
jgi:hypothetical protein